MISPRRTARVLFPLAFLVGITVIGAGSAYAQCSTGTCPTSDNKTSFPQGATVYVDIDVHIRGTQEETEIQNALTSWNTWNQANGSNVTFTTDPPPANLPTDSTYLLHIINGTLTDPTGQPLTATVANFHRNAYDANGNVRDALITFNTGGALANPNDPSSGPYYDPSAAGYDTIFQKMTEHEIGHSLNLNDVDVACFAYGQSVMNPAATCANDICGALPVNVSQCDSDAVGAQPRYQPPPPPPPDPQCYNEYSQYEVFDGGCYEEYTVVDTYCDGQWVSEYYYLSSVGPCVG